MKRTLRLLQSISAASGLTYSEAIDSSYDQVKTKSESYQVRAKPWTLAVKELFENETLLNYILKLDGVIFCVGMHSRRILVAIEFFLQETKKVIFKAFNQGGCGAWVHKPMEQGHFLVSPTEIEELGPILH